jgi:hypothetical protein
MQIARYRSEQDSAPETETIEWAALVHLLTTHERTPCDPCPGKDCPHKHGPAWSPVELSLCPPVCHNEGKLKARNCGGGRFHRLNKNVRAIHAAVFDVDHTSMTELRAIAARIDGSGVAAVIHSSHSNRPTDVCVRVIFPVTRPITADEWPRVRAAAERLFQLPADKSTKDLARLFFLPTCPASVTPIALHTEGASLDVDALIALANAQAGTAQAATLSIEAKPPETTTADPNELRAKLRTLRNRYRDSSKQEIRERGALLDRILGKQPLSLREGKDPVFAGLDDALNRACSLMVTTLPAETPIEAILELVRPSVAPVAQPEGLEHWLTEAWDMVERARERRALNDAASRDFDREVRARLMSDSAAADDEQPLTAPREHKDGEQTNDEAESDDDEHPKSEGYAIDQLERWADEQGTDVTGFIRRWVIQRGKAFYVFVGGRYRAPISKDDLAVSLPRDLARAPIRMTIEEDSGRITPVPVVSILANHATVARDVQASLALQRSFYDARTETFFEAVRPLRGLAAREHKDVHAWLTLLGGDQSEKLLDWVASCMRLDRQSCAIYLDGPKSCGKSLLAYGLARLWTSGGPSELGRVLEGFNDALTVCPLIFADEAIPQRKGITAELRRLIGSTARNLNRKFLPVCNLDGAVRLVIAGNNDHLLDTGEDLSANDLEAVAGRFLYIRAPQAAADYLAALGGPPVVGRWITQNAIAEHALWLRENRQINEGSRFLVEGIVQDFHDNLATSSGLAGLVCEWLVRYLVDPTTTAGASNLIMAGHGEVWVNADAMVKATDWERRVPSSKVPSAAKIGRALRNLAMGHERIRVADKQHKYHRIKPRLLVTWAERSTVVDPETLTARIEAPNEVIAKALGARSRAA